MSNARTARFSRRGLLAAGGALGLGAVLTACGDDDAKDGGADTKGSAASGPWTFKDDRGTTYLEVKPSADRDMPGSGTFFIDFRDGTADAAGALAVYDDIVASVVPLWHEWFQARLRLATIVVGAFASAAAHQSAEVR